ncbi:hypothetical protein BD779DRAFT_1678989 [Infundibulicybe gibba]|nr:hypothetical protein BD779DRAFT_1678989 [Infundibulicybe gibba]
MSAWLSTGVPDPFLGPNGVRMLLVCRGLFGFLCLFGLYYSLQYLSLSDATVLTFLAPLCTAIAGSLLLGEKFSVREALAGVFSLFGVVLIARPAFIFGANSQGGPLPGDIVSVVAEESTPPQRLVAVGIALTCLIMKSTRHFHPRDWEAGPSLHSLTSFSIQCVFVTTIYMVTTKSPFVIPTRLDWLGLLMLIGVFGFIAQILLAMGLQRETAGRGTLALYIQVVFVVVLQRIFFNSIPSALSVCGTLIILTSALYVILTKKKDSGAVLLNKLDEQALEEGLLENGSIEPGESALKDKHLTAHNSIELRPSEIRMAFKRAISPLPIAPRPYPQKCPPHPQMTAALKSPPPPQGSRRPNRQGALPRASAPAPVVEANTSTAAAPDPLILNMSSSPPH